MSEKMTSQKKLGDIKLVPYNKPLFIAFLEQAWQVQQFWYVNLKKKPILSKKITNQIFVSDA
jgi:hypothetical protein